MTKPYAHDPDCDFWFDHYDSECTCCASASHPGLKPPAPEPAQDLRAGLPRRGKSAVADSRFPSVASTAIVEMDDERLSGLIAYLLAYHGGGFVNNTITPDELLAVLEELRAYRSSSAQDGDHANALIS